MDVIIIVHILPYTGLGEGAPSERYKGPQRRLQYELLLDDGCSSHITSLFIAYLTLALQWMS